MCRQASPKKIRPCRHLIGGNVTPPNPQPQLVAIPPPQQGPSPPPQQGPSPAPHQGPSPAPHQGPSPAPIHPCEITVPPEHPSKIHFLLFGVMIGMLLMKIVK